MSKGTEISRIDRVAKELRTLVAEYFLASLNTYFKGLVTVSTVKVTKDLRMANVYISILGEEEAEDHNMDIIDEFKGDIQRYVGRKMSTKYVPKLTFYVDDTYSENFRIMDKLKDLGYETSVDDFEK